MITSVVHWFDFVAMQILHATMGYYLFCQLHPLLLLPMYITYAGIYTCGQLLCSHHYIGVHYICFSVHLNITGQPSSMPIYFCAFKLIQIPLWLVIDCQYGIMITV